MWLVAFSLAILSQSVAAQFDSSSCSTAKGCLFGPPGCIPGQDCRISFSYLEDGDFLDMELFGPVNGNGYVAAGFSTDAFMGDDTVVFCSSVNGVVSNGLAYNKGKEDQILSAPAAALQTTVSAASNNGNNYCHFRQRLVSNTPNVKNLNSNYNILLATGPMNGDALAYHSTDKYVLPRTSMSAYKRDPLGQVTMVAQQDDKAPKSKADVLKTVHGILMVLAWSIFLATGIMFARHFRSHWPDTTLLGVKMWFNMHRTLNMIGIAATIAAFVCIFVALDWQWTGPKATATAEANRAWGSIHSICGLLACVIAWAQPLNAVFRCNPDQKGRFIFNWIHRFFGFGAFVLAATATMIAVVHFKGMFSNRDAALGLYIAYIAVLGLTMIALEALSLKVWWSNRGRVGTEMEMVRMGGIHSSVLSDETVKIQRLQLLLLAFFVVVAIGTAVAISTLIGLH